MAKVLIIDRQNNQQFFYKIIWWKVVFFFFKKRGRNHVNILLENSRFMVEENRDYVILVKYKKNIKIYERL